MATRVITSRDLVKQDAIQFIREQTLKLTLIEARPFSKMYVFFGGQNVTHLCFPASATWAASTSYKGNSLIMYNRNYYRVVGDSNVSYTSGTTPPSHTTGTVTSNGLSLTFVSTVDVVTDNVGQAVIDFNIPSQTFNTGDYEIIVTDSSELNVLTQLGNVNGSAKTMFSSRGTLEIYQPRQLTITTVERPPPPRQDPLAQSFFTYGLDSGIFITSIDVYFNTKDSSIPVRMELRPLVNGYPAPLPPENKNLVSVVAAKDVKTSANASVPTKFKFEPPVYLKQNGDYCFVLRSNSNNYNVFTSRLGETSKEDGRKIYDQPFIGSLFKSENNITWTAEQFEDIKFTMYKAKFNVNSSSDVKFKVNVPPIYSMGDQFYTTSGSNVVRYTHAVDHGLQVNDKIEIVGQSGAVYNGVSSANFSGIKTVTSVVDTKTVEFQVGSNATSTGKLISAGILGHVFVNNGGINYTSSDTVTVTRASGDTTGTGATANLVVVNGAITSVVITNPGSGYTLPPTVTVNTTTGSGAQLIGNVDPAFTVQVNKPMTGFETKIKVNNFDNSKTTSTISTITPEYGTGRTYEFETNSAYHNIAQQSLLASKLNETAKGVDSAVVTVSMTTSNANVAPIIDLSETPALTSFYTSINQQEGETITATDSSAFIEDILTTNAGNNYTIEPIVTISAPDLEDGVQATAEATIDGGSIDTISITEPGSGYTSVPTIVITRASGDTTGVGAAAQAVLSDFNTELLPSGGLAKARYITKQIGLQLASTGVRILCDISSTQGSSVDWYIRTSLSGSDMVHEEQQWRLISCPIPRNKSSFAGETYEYEFKLDNIPVFDVYDLKCVLTASDPTRAPIVYGYRAVIVA